MDARLAAGDAAHSLSPSYLFTSNVDRAMQAPPPQSIEFVVVVAMVALALVPPKTTTTTVMMAAARRRASLRGRSVAASEGESKNQATWLV